MIDDVSITVAELEEWMQGMPGEFELENLNSSLDNGLSLVKDRKVPITFTVTIVP